MEAKAATDRKQMEVMFKDLGRIAYKEAWDLQESLLKESVDIKIELSKAGQSEAQAPTRSHLLFCEHNPVYTLGKSGKDEHLLLNEAERSLMGIEYYHINRGGDITYHGPGQITGYPILDLEKLNPDIGWYLRSLEDIMIRLLDDYGLEGARIKGATGVWIDAGGPWPKKICALGVRTSRWVTMHGFAFNVSTELSYFSNIVPCGITDKGVTTLEQELGRPIEMAEVKAKLKEYFAEQFGFTYT